jgi:hypothetical protein
MEPVEVGNYKKIFKSKTNGTVFYYLYECFLQEAKSFQVKIHSICIKFDGQNKKYTYKSTSLIVTLHPTQVVVAVKDEKGGHDRQLECSPLLFSVACLDQAN